MHQTKDRLHIQRVVELEQLTFPHGVCIAGPALEVTLGNLLTLNKTPSMFPVVLASQCGVSLGTVTSLARLQALVSFHCYFMQQGGLAFRSPSAYPIWLVIGPFRNFTSFVISSKSSSFVLFWDPIVCMLPSVMLSGVLAALSAFGTITHSLFSVSIRGCFCCSVSEVHRGCFCL